MSDQTAKVPGQVTAVSFIVGLLFAAGLGISGMTLPEKVIGFLDITGAWDPSLAFVMGSALVVFGVAYRMSLKRERPVFDQRFGIPKRRDITWQLILGSTLFGVGWGLGGFCPGPAIVSTASGDVSVFIFVVAMTLGMVLQDSFQGWLSRRADHHD